MRHHAEQVTAVLHVTHHSRRVLSDNSSPKHIGSRRHNNIGTDNEMTQRLGRAYRQLGQ